MIKPSAVEKLKQDIVSMQRWTKVAVMVTADAVVLPFCFLAAMLLSLSDVNGLSRFGQLPYLFIPVVTIAVFSLCGLYHAVIRFIDRHLLVRTGSGLAIVVLGTCLVSLVVEESRVPRSALAIYWFIAFSYVVSSRLAVRSLLRVDPAQARLREVVAIFGAGDAGVKLAAAMRAEGQYHPVCFFDDKRELDRQSVAGLKVFHSDKLVETVRSLDIDMIVLAIPTAPPKRRRQVIHAMSKAGVAVKTLSNLIELSDERISGKSIREIKIEDLLGRNPVPPQQGLFAKCVHGLNVLVTGAGGSIGSELCRQIVTLRPKNIHLLEHSEFALYSIDQELRTRFPEVSIHAHLGSVCDADMVDRILRDGKIDTIYHAAAYKHVPIVEANMAEGIRNNVIGTQVIATAAEKHDVATCVLVSTDKAVRPTNVMGASKRIGELIFQAAARTPWGSTTFCMVRLGNVLASSGSVIPVFQRQIQEGGPVTITHPEIIRYFMLIPEAAQLIIQAGAMAEGGDVFVLDMGEPIKILDLARTMIEMCGLVVKDEESPDGDIEIKFVGLRPGEKLYEELLIGANTFPTAHPRILGASENSIHRALLVRMIERLMAACERGDEASIKSAIKAIVPEYVPQTTVPQTAEPCGLPAPSLAHEYTYRPVSNAFRPYVPALLQLRLPQPAYMRADVAGGRAHSALAH